VRTGARRLTLGMRLERLSLAFAGLLPSCFVAIVHLLEFDLIFYFAISGRANLVRRCRVAGVRQVYHLRPICSPLRAPLANAAQAFRSQPQFELDARQCNLADLRSCH
jgi:hypothetical protein